MFNSTNIMFGGWPGGLGNNAKCYAGGTSQATAPKLPQADYVSINGGAGHATMPNGQQGDEITIGVAIASPVTLWPPASGKIAGATASVSLAANTITTYRCVGFNSWFQTMQVTASALPGSEGIDDEGNPVREGEGFDGLDGLPPIPDGTRPLTPPWPGQPGQPQPPLAPGQPFPIAPSQQPGTGYWQDKPELWPGQGTAPVGQPGQGGFSLGPGEDPGFVQPPTQTTDPVEPAPLGGFTTPAGPQTAQPGEPGFIYDYNKTQNPGK